MTTTTDVIFGGVPFQFRGNYFGEDAYVWRHLLLWFPAGQKHGAAKLSIGRPLRPNEVRPDLYGGLGSLVVWVMPDGEVAPSKKSFSITVETLQMMVESLAIAEGVAMGERKQE